MWLCQNLKNTSLTQNAVTLVLPDGSGAEPPGRQATRKSSAELEMLPPRQRITYTFRLRLFGWPAVPEVRRHYKVTIAKSVI